MDKRANRRNRRSHVARRCWLKDTVPEPLADSSTTNTGLEAGKRAFFDNVDTTCHSPFASGQERKVRQMPIPAALNLDQFSKSASDSVLMYTIYKCTNCQADSWKNKRKQPLLDRTRAGDRSAGLAHDDGTHRSYMTYTVPSAAKVGVRVV